VGAHGGEETAMECQRQRTTGELCSTILKNRQICLHGSLAKCAVTGAADTGCGQLDGHGISTILRSALPESWRYRACHQPGSFAVRWVNNKEQRPVVTTLDKPGCRSDVSVEWARVQLPCSWSGVGCQSSAGCSKQFRPAACDR